MITFCLRFFSNSYTYLGQTVFVFFKEKLYLDYKIMLYLDCKTDINKHEIKMQFDLFFITLPSLYFSSLRFHDF